MIVFVKVEYRVIELKIQKWRYHVSIKIDLEIRLRFLIKNFLVSSVDPKKQTNNFMILKLISFSVIGTILLSVVKLIEKKM